MVMGKTPNPPTLEARLFHRGLGRAEVFDYPPQELDRLKAHLSANGYESFSLHAPMPRPTWFPYSGVTCFFLNEDPAKRERSFQVVEDTLALARAWQAEYVVTHLTFGPTDTRNPSTATALARAACARLAEAGSRCQVPVHIEFAAYTEAFHAPDDFLEAVLPHSGLRICIDVGHTFLGACRWDRDYFDDIRALAPHASSLHLWNTRDHPDHRDQGHIPLDPAQSPAEGWVDIARTLQIVLAANPDAAIVFEYPVAEVTPAIQAGYDWVGEIVNNITGICGEPLP